MKQILAMELVVPEGYRATGEYRPPNDELCLIGGNAVRVTSPLPNIILQAVGEMDWWPEWLTANWIYQDQDNPTLWKMTNVEPVYIETTSRYNTGWWGTVEIGGTLGATELNAHHVAFCAPDTKGKKFVRFKNPRCTNPTLSPTGIRKSTVVTTSSRYDDDLWGGGGYSYAQKKETSADVSAASAISAALKDIKAGVAPATSGTTDTIVDPDFRPTDPRTREDAIEYLDMANRRLEALNASQSPSAANEFLTLQEDVDRISRFWDIASGGGEPVAAVALPGKKKAKGSHAKGNAKSATGSVGVPQTEKEAIARINFLNERMEDTSVSDEQISNYAEEISELCKAWSVDWPS